MSILRHDCASPLQSLLVVINTWIFCSSELKLNVTVLCNVTVENREI